MPPPVFHKNASAFAAAIGRSGSNKKWETLLQSAFSSICGLLAGRFKSYLVRYKYFLIAFLFSALFLKFFPQIDIFISGLFYEPKILGFPMSIAPVAMTVYNAVNLATVIIAVVFVLVLVFDIFLKERLFGISRKALIFLLISLIVGPGIIVNGIFKENIGRPRPAAIIEFGGDKEFVPPFTQSNACSGNCSFPSGHAALGFYFSAFGFIVTGAMRKKVIGAGIVIGIIVSIIRIMQGRHFFSDTLFAFFFVFLTISLTYELMFGSGES